MSREQLPTVLIVTEGLTEKKYLSHLSRRNAGYLVRVVESPRKDPVSIVKFCIKEMSNRGLSPKDGDMVYCVIDVDFNKEIQLKKSIALAKKNGISIVLSNPCFEVFFIFHFRDALPTFASPDEAVEYLKGFIPDYTKNKDYWHLLEKDLDVALERVARELDEIPLVLGSKSTTNIGRLFDDIKKMNET